MARGGRVCLASEDRRKEEGDCEDREEIPEMKDSIDAVLNHSLFPIVDPHL